VGETREFEIIYENDAEGSLTLSLRRMQVRGPCGAAMLAGSCRLRLQMAN